MSDVKLPKQTFTKFYTVEIPTWEDWKQDWQVACYVYWWMKNITLHRLLCTWCASHPHSVGHGIPSFICQAGISIIIVCVAEWLFWPVYLTVEGPPRTGFSVPIITDCRELCDFLILLGSNIKWSHAEFHTILISRAMTQQVAKAGAKEILIGPESFTRTAQG